MDINQKIMGKNGLACVKMAKSLIKVPIGARMPTVSELANSNCIPVGTTHNALRTLIEYGAIEIIPRGHMGSFLVGKDVKKLLSIIGVQYIFGAMPITENKYFKGLASGIISQMNNEYNVPINLAYMRGSKTRIEMLINGRYDFVIVSKMAANEYIKKNGGIDIVLNFGIFSYTQNYSLKFHNASINEIKDGMRIGIDPCSIDQIKLSKDLCRKKKVEYIEILSSRMDDELELGNIDAALIYDDNIIYDDIPVDGSCAVLIVDSEKMEVAEIIRDLIDKREIIEIQKQVVEGKIKPRY